jgi:HK97 family phage major capsid protein
MPRENPKIVELREKIENGHKAVSEKFDAHDEAIEKDANAQMSAEDVKFIKDTNKQTEAYEHEAADLLDMEGQRTAHDRRGREMGRASNQLPHPSETQRAPGTNRNGRRMTIGQQVVADKEMAAFMSNLPRVPQKQRVDSPAVELGGQMMGTLFTGASDTSAGAFVVPDRTGIFDMGTFMRPLTLRDVITHGNTESDVVEFVRMTAFTNNADTVPEASATAGVSGTKPESGGALELVQTNVKTIAHWIPATRRAVADAGQLRTLIDTILMYGIDEKLEDLLAKGDGVGENFLGVLNQPNISTQSFDTDRLTTSRKARTKVRTLGRAQATAFVMHPNDWEAFDLMKDNEGRYYYGGPSVLGIPRLWGLPVVECEAFDEGTGVVADWRLAILWDREQSNILTSDSHQDFFVRNLVAILAEMRAAFDLIRPQAFVETDFAA